jgi:hypothetical protein
MCQPVEIQFGQIVCHRKTGKVSGQEACAPPGPITSPFTISGTANRPVAAIGVAVNQLTGQVHPGDPPIQPRSRDWSFTFTLPKGNYALLVLGWDTGATARVDVVVGLGFTELEAKRPLDPFLTVIDPQPGDVPSCFLAKGTVDAVSSDVTADIVNRASGASQSHTTTASDTGGWTIEFDDVDLGPSDLFVTGDSTTIQIADINIVEGCC